MIQEEKELLLKDLCARLPYGVICTDSRHGNSRITEVDIVDETVYCFDFDEYSEIKHIKLYLRPMSSMTEDERKEFVATQYEEVIEQYPHSAAPSEIKILSYTTKTFDWLNANHFDYHGLILKGLALEAPKELYKT